MGRSAAPPSEICRSLYDCPLVSVGPSGQQCRVVVASHPASEKKSRVGVQGCGLVYELFLTNLPQGAFTAADVVELYLHRGAFEATLADEEQEQDPDRWCSHAPCGQECWQIVSQWVWNEAPAAGPSACSRAAAHRLSFAPVVPSGTSGYASAEAALRLQSGPLLWAGLSASSRWDAALSGWSQPLSPATAHRARWQPARGLWGQDEQLPPLSLARAVPVAWGSDEEAPSGESEARIPSKSGRLPCVFRDWSRRQHRRACMQLLGRQRVEVQTEQATPPAASSKEVILSRAHRAHSRLSFAERLARNARAPTASRPTITLFGIPDAFATWLGLAIA
jgi:hypothetical protein